MRSIRVAYCAGALVLASVGCGGDDDAPAVDGGSEECGNHGQPECPDAAPGVDDTWRQKTSGEFRLELRYLADGSPRIISEAYFHHGQIPGRLPGGVLGTCVDLFGFNSNANAGFYQDTRTYDSVGASLTMDNGEDEPIVMERNENTNDFRGLPHPQIYVQGGLSVNGVQPEQVVAGSSYDITLADTSLPPIPVDMIMPQNFSTVGGNMAFATAGVPADPQVLDPAEDLTWQFEAPQQDGVNLAFLVFTNGGPTTGGEAWFCPQLVDEGEITIPAAMTKAFPRSGTIFAATVSHQIAEWNEGSLDMIGINCLNASYSFADP